MSREHTLAGTLYTLLTLLTISLTIESVSNSQRIHTLKDSGHVWSNRVRQLEQMLEQKSVLQSVAIYLAA